MTDAGIGDRVNKAFQNSNVTLWSWDGCCCQYRYVPYPKLVILLVFQDAMRSDTPLKQQPFLRSHLCYLGHCPCYFVVVSSFMEKSWICDCWLCCLAKVSNIPEGLPPAIVTIVLSFGTKLLAKRHSIKTSCQKRNIWFNWNIASDKTGMLTMNKMTVSSTMVPTWLSWWYWTRSSNATTSSSLSCQWYENRAWKVSDCDPTETAFIQYASVKRYDVKGFFREISSCSWIAIWLWPKLMSTVHPSSDGRFL